MQQSKTKTCIECFQHLQILLVGIKLSQLDYDFTVLVNCPTIYSLYVAQLSVAMFCYIRPSEVHFTHVLRWGKNKIMEKGERENDGEGKSCLQHGDTWSRITARRGGRGESINPYLYKW